jgi:hypothetical protein
MSFGFRCSLDFFRFGLSGFVNVTTAHQRGARYPGTCYIFKQNVKSLYLVHKLNLLSTADLLQKQPTTSIFIGDVF